jgi:hypothetical protein
MRRVRSSSPSSAEPSRLSFPRVARFLLAVFALSAALAVVWVAVRPLVALVASWRAARSVDQQVAVRRHEVATLGARKHWMEDPAGEEEEIRRQGLVRNDEFSIQFQLIAPAMPAAQAAGPGSAAASGGRGPALGWLLLAALIPAGALVRRVVLVRMRRPAGALRSLPELRRGR